MGVQTIVLPFTTFAGLRGELPTFRTDNCKAVHGLEACEGEMLIYIYKSQEGIELNAFGQSVDPISPVIRSIHT